MLIFKNASEEEKKAIYQILPILDSLLPPNDTEVELFYHSDSSIVIAKTESGYSVHYSSRVGLMRAIGLLVQHIDEDTLNMAQTPVLENLTLLLDNSRNAVLNIESFKRIAGIAALMGYTIIMLYMEDTYTVNDYPYFGYMRGRYTPDELREMDDYAYLLGIELVPSIQTLAHMKSIFRWQCFSECQDIDDALLCDEDATYRLIDKMLCSLSKNLRSKKVNIGMDETRSVGRGKHLDRYGEEKRIEIILRHLEKVSGICQKYNLKPTIWSDIISKSNLDSDGNINKDILNRIPENTDLCFWSYESISKEFYDGMFKKHKDLVDNRLSFAGSTSSWFGWVPLNKFAVNVLKSSLASVKSNNIKNVTVTFWGDNGGDCSVFSTLSTLQYFAEFYWTGTLDDENVKKRLKICADADYDSFVNMEFICNLPSRTDYGYSNINPYRYMFYQDLLMGLFDRHIPEGSNEHFKKCSVLMKESADINPKWAYLFKTLESMCKVLSIKAELGLKIYNAYKCSNKEQLKEYCRTDIPVLCDYLDEFLKTYRKQWQYDNKLFGYEVQNIRIAGVIAQVKDAKITIEDYISGKIKKIEQLEEERLFYDCRDEDSAKPVLRHAVDWNLNVSASDL